MFNNTLLLFTSHTIALSLPALVDGPTNRKTLRSWTASDGVVHEFSIGHQATSENPGFDTTRSVVRLAITRLTADGKKVTTYAQLVLSHNNAAEALSSGDATNAVAALCVFLKTGGAAAPPSGDDTIGDVTTVVGRLTQGEP